MPFLGVLTLPALASTLIAWLTVLATLGFHYYEKEPS